MKHNRPAPPPSVLAAALAQQLGDEIGVPLGSAWYPGLARGVLRDLESGIPLRQAEEELRFGLGIPTPGEK